ncbi:hypothetical protein [Sphingomonas sp. ACRSK]|nr:hypothetical protein [Sphingomonas sp. ACRSK]MCG7346609.1 hypothetical protein [Sphingomonas sp. ACRSK]
MNDPDVFTFGMFAAWAAFSLARIAYQSRRSAEAIEKLVGLAERGRR